MKRNQHSDVKPMKNPAHPGAVLKGLVLQPLNLTVAAAAEKLDVDRTTLSRLLNGRIAVSVDMAIRLAKAVQNTTPQFWLAMQHNYDLAQARTREKIYARVRPFESESQHVPM